MIIVTGGAGFIGSNVVATLAKQHPSGVVVCDWLETGDKWRNIAKAELADVIMPEDLESFLGHYGNEVELIVHMGAISATTERDADLIVETNIRLTLDLWNWCAAHGKRFIYASSAATYGDGTAGFDDDMAPEALAKLVPLNAYGWSKHMVDRRFARLIKQGKPTPPQWAGLKFFNVYGPNEYHKDEMRSVIHKIFPSAAKGEAVTLFKSHNPDYEDGGQSRDFVYVKDCANVISWMAQTPTVSGLFNLGTGEARSFKDLATATFAALNRKPNINYVDTPEQIRDKYQYFTEAKMDRLRAAGYDKPFTSLEDGVMDYVQNYLVKPDPFL